MRNFRDRQIAGPKGGAGAVNGGRSSRAQTALLLVCGVVAGSLFVMTFIAEGATRADYSPLRHSISSLALGPSGWVQTVNFLAAGGLKRPGFGARLGSCVDQPAGCGR
jgi:Protein of unknown function (DUF998)